MSTSSTSRDRALIEDLSLALVREYLAKKKYRTTLETLASELPVKPVPTTTTALARNLGITKFVARNAKADEPYATLLEIFAEYMYNKYGRDAAEESASTASGKPSLDRVSSKPTASSLSSTRDSDEQIARSMAKMSLGRTPTTTTTPMTSRTVASQQQQSLSPSSYSTPVGGGSVASSRSNERTRDTTRESSRDSKDRDGTSTFSVRPGSASRSGRSNPSSPPRSSAAPTPAVSKPLTVTTSSASSKSRHSDLMIEEDIDFSDEDEQYTKASSFAKPGASALTNVSRGGSSAASSMQFPTSPVPAAINMTLDQAHRVKSLIFGASHLTGTFTDQWLVQGFYFKPAEIARAVPSLACGLVQAQGGPCGIIAVVQAFLLKQLLFTGAYERASSVKRRELLTSCTPDTLKRALIDAWTDIVWLVASVGEDRRARVCLRNPAATKMAGARKMPNGIIFKPDGISEALAYVELNTRDAVRNFFTVYYSVYTETAGFGVVLFLYSVILTRGVENVESDRDENTSLIGAHSYCSQEMVNLTLTGRARSNVFNGTKDFDGLVLRGIDRRAEIGFLSLFEHYENILVGSHLKQPVYPIWVICSESHYSVAYCLDSDAVGPQPPGNGVFDLLYYDQLANQKEEIRLTVDTTKKGPPPKEHADLEPPINECIRTRWGKHARVDWNGVEPIL